MQARMKNPAMIIPGAMEALQGLEKAAEQSGVPKKTLDLVHLRASQINGCSVCVDMNFRFKKADQASERLLRSLLGKTLPDKWLVSGQNQRRQENGERKK